MELQKSLDRLKAKIEGGMPEEYVKIMHQATKDLEDSGIGEGILKVGEKAPIFSLPNQEGELVSSEELLKNGPLVLTFYRGVWCPYCNTDLAYLNKFSKEISELKGTIVSISPQIADNNKLIVERQRLNYDLLSDKGNEVAEQFGLRWELQEPLKSLYNDQFNINLPAYNGEDSWSLPVPARFIVNQDGIIVYAEYSVDYTKRPNSDVLIDELKKL
ncbi:peroxiredoxin-like family protein [Flammeovirga agarivorans]|uniref:thioredoxin-dependent peroxiredoxin n=1 Tax=Flammeovirga agarivorans TaxID=2726742 RepID=A0A7X8XYL5_9BACT|nr:peroxiredoxin-like family protein [Flammeovirga agarivorans]NLR94337.1 AhpC/TSA family protein [Flammeovirga agarivorans]